MTVPVEVTSVVVVVVVVEGEAAVPLTIGGRGGGEGDPPFVVGEEGGDIFCGGGKLGDSSSSVGTNHTYKGLVNNTHKHVKVHWLSSPICALVD